MAIDTKITPVPPDELKESHGWRDWFKKIYVLLQNMEHEEGHWYLTNGARHAINTSSGVQTTTTTVTNTVTETILYTYTFASDEIHADEQFVFSLSGIVTNASAADDYTLKVYTGGTLRHTLSRVGGNVTDAGWEVTYTGTCRTTGASGTFVDNLRFTEGTIGQSQAHSTAHTINTTAATEVKLTITWAAAKAGNTISCTQGIVRFYH